ASSTRTTAESSQRTAKLTQFEPKTVALREQRNTTQYRGHSSTTTQQNPQETAQVLNTRSAAAQAQTIVRPPRVASVTADRPAKYKTTYPENPAWMSGLFGILLVGVLAAISIWGFWELTDRLVVPQKQQSTTVTPQIEPPERPKQTSLPQVALPRPKETPKVRPQTTSLTPMEIKRRPKTKSRVVRRVIRSPKSQPALVVEQADIEQPRSKPPRVSTQDTKRDTPLPPPKPV